MPTKNQTMKFLTRKNLATLTLVVLVSCGVVFGVGRCADAQTYPRDEGAEAIEYHMTIDGQDRVFYMYSSESSPSGFVDGSGYQVFAPDDFVANAKKTGTEVSVGPKSSEPTAVSNFLGWILFYIATGFSTLVGIMIDLLVRYVITYNNFVNHDIVETGWTIVRDVANNFFIVILLVIAVATTLRQPAQYQYQSALPKLLIMVVLINFSKLFTGILIDISQILTIFFANAMQANAGGVILVALGLGDYYSAWVAGGGAPAVSSWSVVIQLIFALIASVVAAVVVTSLAIMFVIRIITLWFLIILSPAAFFAYAVPGGQQYFGQWWGRLTKELIVGPVAMFFLYLSLFAGANFKEANTAADFSVNAEASRGSVDQINAGGQAAFGTYPEQIFNFLIIIGLMVMTLVAAQTVGAEGSKFAGMGLSKLKDLRNKGFGAAKKTALGTWEVSKAVGRGADKMVLGGRVGGYIAAAQTKTGMTAGVATGSAVGAALGTVLGPLGTVLGAGAGAAVASVVAGKMAKSTSGMMRRYRQNEQNRYKASMGEGKVDEILDGKGERMDGLNIDRDASGQIIKIQRKDATTGAMVDVNTSESVQLWNKEKGVYERAKHNGTKWDFDREKQVIQGGEQARKSDGTIITAAASSINAGTTYLDANGRYTSVKSNAAYKFDPSTSSYVKLEDDQVLRKSDGTAETRWAEYEGIDGKKYRKNTEDSSYFEFNGSKNNFEKDKNGEKIAAKGAITGADIKTMGSAWTKFYAGYSSGMSKSYAAQNAAEADKINKIQKEYDGLPKEQLRQLLDVEKDGAKLTAIALTMGVKKAFKETDVAGAVKAKEALQSNPVLLKQFNDEMNKKFMVLNNSTIGADGKTKIDDSAIAKLVSAGDAKWADQNSKQMTPESLKVMAKQMGTDFHKELEKMIKTDRDKINIGSALAKNLDNLTFSGEDLSVRKSAGAINGDWVQAFSSGGVLNQAALATAIKNIPDAKVFGTVSDSNFSNNNFKEAIATSLSMAMLNKMIKNYEVSDEKMRLYAKAIKEFAGTNTADKNGTPAEKAAYLVDQALHHTSNTDLTSLFS